MLGLVSKMLQVFDLDLEVIVVERIEHVFLLWLVLLQLDVKLVLN